VANLKIEQFTRNSFTDFLDEQGYAIADSVPVEKLCTLKVDPADWFEFMQDNWMDCFCAPYEPRPILDDLSNQQMLLANHHGYHSGNTIKRDWGKDPKHDAQFKELVDVTPLGLDPATTQIRLLCYQPGNIFPVHWDGLEGWGERFGIDKTPTRFSVLVNPYSWGQYLQIHNTMITNWTPGDSYVIPTRVLHCSGNGGVVPKVTLTVTGLVE
jgi:hypothetical protein